ncbi:hypothetical protein L211DRAFT_854615 [Terfezia boudieri ATCC MYA-4762]|uniref:Uncharacterized protein n=1 Tax=Terfezia boudieri ATCC MYA-4762 TaxID=1051890 RepID=A0A3N4L509_9PEZI|nr:hypothetical protein L211DRAFT_854615 [Terfezia boudieri ATCC MYA-4762]
MYHAAKLAGPISDRKKPSAVRGRNASDGGLIQKRRDQMHELEGNKRLRFQEAIQEESIREDGKEITKISDSEHEREERNSGDGSDSDIVEIKGLPNSCRKSRSFTTIPLKLQGLKSVHSRHKSYIDECRQKILRLYRLDYQSKEEVAKKVEWLLHKDRFVCREEQREHCLKELRTGEASEAMEFKYETAASSFHRLQNTWGLYDEKVRTLILANIKADLRTRIGGFDKKSEMEASDPCAVVEGESYITELQEELRYTMLAQKLVGSDIMSEKTRGQGSTGTTEAIEQIQADVADMQEDGSPTDVDEPVQVDDSDWQESQVAY